MGTPAENQGSGESENNSAHASKLKPSRTFSLPVPELRDVGGRQNGVDRDGEGRNRTGDTTVFSRVLYQLSYLARRAAV
jgi:hypothetical protein